ncbi:hypothetical protein OXL99_16055 [Pseudomonas fulva]|nr:hypothetical protein OXL99_16055 [Pseudomonas fulva]
MKILHQAQNGRLSQLDYLIDREAGALRDFEIAPYLPPLQRIQGRAARQICNQPLHMQLSEALQWNQPPRRGAHAFLAGLVRFEAVTQPVELSGRSALEPLRQARGYEVMGSACDLGRGRIEAGSSREGS